MKIIAEILEDEKKEIQILFEKLNSLKLMAGTLADARLEKEEENWFYNKLINDTTETRNKFENWWFESSEKYNLDRSIINEYIVDFEKNQILLNK